MTKAEHLFVILGEECSEVNHRISKILRFGLNDIESGQNLTCEERLIYEFNDLIAVMEILKDENLIKNIFDKDMIELKKEKIKKYLEYSEKNNLIEKNEHST